MNTSFYSLFESLLEATFEILKRILCTLKWNSAKFIVPSLSFFFYIVLQKWIYSCFSKLVQNKVFWKKIFKLYPHQLKIHWGFCTDGAQFLPLPFPPPPPPPIKEHFLTIPSQDKLSHVYNMWAQIQASLAPKAFNSTCTWLGFPKCSQTHFTDNLKPFFPRTFEGLFWGKCLFVPDAEGSSLYRPHEEKNPDHSSQNTRTRISLKCEDRFF